jgi:hypothetical protein
MRVLGMNLATIGITSSFSVGQRQIFKMRKIPQSFVFNNKTGNTTYTNTNSSGAKREADCERLPETPGGSADRQELTKGSAAMSEAYLSEIIDRHQVYVVEMLKTADRTNDPFWAKKLKRMAGLLLEGIGEYQKRLPA